MPSTVAQQAATVYASVAAVPWPEADMPHGPLCDLCQTDRLHYLDRLEAYFRGRQDEGKLYDWDGNFRGYGDEADIQPGYYVPLRRRKPSARYDLGRLIVRRLTAMVFGQGRWPLLTVEDDPATEDFARELVRASSLPARMVEARDLGGAMGTGVLSYAFVRGHPRVEVHNAKHCRVLEWSDRTEFRPAAVLKAYRYEEEVWDGTRWKEQALYYARLWTLTDEIEWEPIPEEQARSPLWWRLPSHRVTHGVGTCPIVWVQNAPDSQEIDGEGDYEGGLTELFDEVNLTLSANTKGTRANVDPTLVVKASHKLNLGSIRKGSENAIFAEGGADYLELRGDAMRAARDLCNDLSQKALDVAQVILADPEKLSGAAQSAAALRILYAPMLSRCDVLREQYGQAIVAVVEGLLEMARHYGQVREEGGGYVELAPRFEVETVEVEEEGENGQPMTRLEQQRRQIAREPGEGEQIRLAWPPYFPPTWQDKKTATEAAKLANGGKAVLSQRTSLEAVAGLYGVEDLEAELHEMHEDSERAIEAAQKAFTPALEGGPHPAYEGEEKEREDRAGGKPSSPPGPGQPPERAEE
jgi:hypothetical protein